MRVDGGGRTDDGLRTGSGRKRGVGLRDCAGEVSPFDPVTFVFAIPTVLLVALLATWLPARRASRVDPMLALRAD